MVQVAHCLIHQGQIVVEGSRGRLQLDRAGKALHRTRAIPPPIGHDAQQMPGIGMKWSGSQNALAKSFGVLQLTGLLVLCGPSQCLRSGNHFGGGSGGAGERCSGQLEPYSDQSGRTANRTEGLIVV